ncbi:PH domain-containing protein [Bifidobacterium sp. UTBIF-78]|uniref:PH domain-containing protein n=1 Tax=Bifidobacterium sp. UTBIF-78 TaxID=1465263 RepID=UPI0015E2D815|nr:PH domain-containing protein [Bifidobacterium sp. UTBIF-78]TPF93507.1 hypothetical protein BG22_07190 [Bifidobacterium sp. UTBIF-78]
MSDSSNAGASLTTDDFLMADVPPTAAGPATADLSQPTGVPPTSDVPSGTTSSGTATRFVTATRSATAVSSSTAVSSGTATPSGTDPTSDSRPSPGTNPDSDTGPDHRPSPDVAWRMLHPTALVVGLTESIKGVVGLFLGLLIIMREHLSPLVIMLIIVVVTLVALAQPAIDWFTTRYRLGPDSLSFKSGLFFRKNRTISYGSIHAINSASPVYLQPFGVVRLTVSAAGAADTDIRLDAVPTALQLELERLRAASGGKAGDTIPAETTGVASTGNLGVAFTGITGTISIRNPGASPTEATGATSAETTGVASTGNLGVVSTGITGTISIGNPSASPTQTTNVASIEDPSSASAGNAGTISIGNPSATLSPVSSVSPAAPVSPAQTTSNQPAAGRTTLHPTAPDRTSPDQAPPSRTAFNQVGPNQELPSRETPPGTSSRPTTSPAISRRPASAQAPVFRASVKDIVLYSITDIGFIAAAFVVFGFVQNVQDILPRRLMHDAVDSFGALLARGLTAIVLLILACVILLMTVSIVRSLLQFYGFEVWRRGDDLVVVRGLFTRHTTAIPVSRIQTVTIRQSLLRRPFHLCSVGLGLSSSVASSSEESGISAARILPVIGTSRVYDVLHAMLPEWDVRRLGETRGESGSDAAANDESPSATATPGEPQCAVAVREGAVAAHGESHSAAAHDHPCDELRGTVAERSESRNTADGLPHAASPGMPHVMALRRTGRRLLRYYLTMPLAITLAATALAGLGSEAGPLAGLGLDTVPGPVPDFGWPWWVSVLLFVGGLWWTVTRWLKSHAEGYAVLPDGDGCYGIETSAVANARPTMSHRIAVTGAVGMTTYLMVTRRARVQSITRSTTLWREPHGIERVQMSLFVMNGLDTLRFMFLHRSDAATLERWLKG